jgi:hypothetical protein
MKTKNQTVVLSLYIIIFISCAPTCRFWAKDNKEMKYTKSKIEKVAKIIKIVDHNGTYEIIYKEK